MGLAHGFGMRTGNVLGSFLGIYNSHTVIIGDFAIEPLTTFGDLNFCGFQKYAERHRKTDDICLILPCIYCLLNQVCGMDVGSQ